MNTGRLLLLLGCLSVVDGHVSARITTVQGAKNFKFRGALGDKETHRQHTDLDARVIVAITSVLCKPN